jgi:hypothetical protein
VVKEKQIVENGKAQRGEGGKNSPKMQELR